MGEWDGKPVCRSCRLDARNGIEARVQEQQDDLTRCLQDAAERIDMPDYIRSLLEEASGVIMHLRASLDYKHQLLILADDMLQKLAGSGKSKCACTGAAKTEKP